MSTASDTEPTKKKNGDGVDDADSTHGFDPDSFRMTIGEHLEELRGRLILAIMGLTIAVIGCLLFAEKVMVFFCAPLNTQLVKNGLPAQVYYSDLTDPFMTYLKITMIVAAALAGPWIIYQIWLFVASGLYPNERKTITRYIPLSVSLFVGGLVFVYFIVLPLSIGFFLKFSIGLSPNMKPPAMIYTGPLTSFHIPVYNGNPSNPTSGETWIDQAQGDLRVAVPSVDGGALTIRSIPFGPDSMMAPIITIGDYISLVITFMLTFGIAFQLPLVMLAVVSIGIVDIEFLKTKRKIVFFVMTVAAAFLAPGDIVTSMLALLIPLVILYEFGLMLIKAGDRRKARDAILAEEKEAAEHARETGAAPPVSVFKGQKRIHYRIGMFAACASIASIVLVTLVLNGVEHLPIYPCLIIGGALALTGIGCGLLSRRTPFGKVAMAIGAAAAIFTVLIFFRFKGMAPQTATPATTAHPAPARWSPSLPAPGISGKPNSGNNP